MTLILGAVAQTVAHQAGDRLVLAARGKRLSQHDPLSNKQVVVIAPDALVAIGYTGLAYLGGRPTDDVIAEAVAGLPVGRGITAVARISPIHDVANRIAECLSDAVANDARFGVDVAMVGLKRGRRGRVEPLLWEIKKRPGAELEVERAEETPFDWGRRFAVQHIGDIDQAEIERPVRAMKALEEEGIDRRDAITRLLVETIRKISEKKATVGADCMVVRLWRQGSKAIAEVEFRPVARGRVSIEGTEPAIVKGHGGWTIGDVEFRIRAPDARAEGGPAVYFGSQDRPPPPA